MSPSWPVAAADRDGSKQPALGRRMFPVPFHLDEPPMTRREMLATTGSSLAWLSTSALAAAQSQSLPMLKNMGGEGPGFGNRNRAGGFDILEHCRGLGLGVVRLNVPQGGPDAVRALARSSTHTASLHRQSAPSTDTRLPLRTRSPRPGARA